MSSPFNIQEIYRIRDDTTAAEAGTPNWVTTEDQDPSGSPLSWNTATTFRIRFVQANTGAGNANAAWTLRVNKNSTSYVLITTSSADVQSVDAGSDVDATVLTTANFELTAGTGSAVSGEYDEDGTINTNTGSGGFTEFEWGLTIVDADVDDGDTLDFQIFYNGAALDQVDITPRISVVKGVAVFPDSWFIPFADPVPPSDLATSKQQALTFDPEPIPDAAVGADSWFVPFPGPVRSKSGLLAALQDFFTTDLEPIAAAEPPAIPPQGSAPSPMLRVINRVSGY